MRCNKCGHTFKYICFNCKEGKKETVPNVDFPEYCPIEKAKYSLILDCHAYGTDITKIYVTERGEVERVQRVPWRREKGLEDLLRYCRENEKEIQTIFVSKYFHGRLMGEHLVKIFQNHPVIKIKEIKE